MMEEFSAESSGAADESVGAAAPEEGTILNPKHHGGLTDINADVCLRQQFYTYRTTTGVVVGKTFNVMFTIDQPAAKVWPYFKDFNLWQNSYNHYYSGVLGDLEGKTFAISTTKEFGRHRWQVIRVIPEHVIVLLETDPEGGRPPDSIPDCHVFMLNEHGDKTVMTILMQHSSMSSSETESQMLDHWKKVAAESQRKWRDVFIPILKKIVRDGD
jgi:hypothetical protein